VVGGLERFRDHFREHGRQYALIGGSACDLLMEQAGLAFRATKDLDIVLIAERLDAGFGRCFWEFIHAGGYAAAQSSEGKTRYYRFVSPRVSDFPAVLEVFSVRPEGIPLAEGARLAPIPLDEGVSSLSAILLQEEYYSFLKEGIRLVDGVPVVGPGHLVPLKARAWLDLRERKAAGHAIHNSDISKHRKDVFRLYLLLDPTPGRNVPLVVQEDMRRFVIEVRGEPVDLKNLGIARSSLDKVLEQLVRIYGAG
jgi:hypothetical protein